MARFPKPARPAYVEVADDIREQILSGRLAVGEWLGTEPELCDTYQVSRSTMREALKTLMSQGLVTTRRGMYGGTVVSDFGHADVRSGLDFGMLMLLRTQSITLAEAFEARRGIEVLAIGLAADRATDEQLATLRRAVPASTEGLGEAELTARSVEFHRALLAASGNRVLATIGEPLISPEHNRQAKTVQDLFEELLGDTNYWLDQLEHHRAIVDAIAARDAASAVARFEQSFDEVLRVAALLDAEMERRRHVSNGPAVMT